MKRLFPYSFGPALLLASLAGMRGVSFSESSRLRRADPIRQGRAEGKRQWRNARRLHLARYRGAFGPEPFARGQEPWL